MDSASGNILLLPAVKIAYMLMMIESTKKLNLQKIYRTGSAEKHVQIIQLNTAFSVWKTCVTIRSATQTPLQAVISDM